MTRNHIASSSVGEYVDRRRIESDISSEFVKNSTYRDLLKSSSMSKVYSATFWQVHRGLEMPDIAGTLEYLAEGRPQGSRDRNYRRVLDLIVKQKSGIFRKAT